MMASSPSRFWKPSLLPYNLPGTRRRRARAAHSVNRATRVRQGSPAKPGLQSSRAKRVLRKRAARSVLKSSAPAAVNAHHARRANRAYRWMPMAINRMQAGFWPPCPEVRTSRFPCLPKIKRQRLLILKMARFSAPFLVLAEFF
jgi:hypothetical protein